MIQSGFINQAQHQVYWEEWGNPEGTPIVIVHGGPGGAMNHKWGQFFRPDSKNGFWRIVYIDQRGCGKSLPFGETQNNSTDDLIEDMEKIRQVLNIDKWALFGGSWGTTLSLAYGVKYPKHCLGFILRGVWLARQKDIDWFLWDAKQVYPDAHDALLEAITYSYGQTPINASEVIRFSYHVFSHEHFDDATKIKLANAWFGYEMFMSAIEPLILSYEGLSEEEAKKEQQKAISVAKLEAHYLFNHLPFKDSLLQQVANSTITTLPCEIVHGRYDMVCPVEEAYLLKKVWKNATLDMVANSGHYTFEKTMEASLWQAALRLETKISNS
jgi:proline iminopeptidase